jgi:hypothetical protein
MPASPEAAELLWSDEERVLAPGTRTSGGGSRPLCVDLGSTMRWQNLGRGGRLEGVKPISSSSCPCGAALALACAASVKLVRG